MNKRRNTGGTVRNFCVDCGSVFRTLFSSTRVRCAKCEKAYRAKMDRLSYAKRHGKRSICTVNEAPLVKYDPILSRRH